jgi:hypothetical protein
MSVNLECIEFFSPKTTGAGRLAGLGEERVKLE